MRNRATSASEGWTLTEIMIVILIIGVLIAIAVPAFSKARMNARIGQAEGEVQMLAAAIMNLAWDTGKWPGAIPRNVQSGAEIWDLRSAKGGLLASHSDFSDWKGPYINRIVVDPWGNPYFFDPDYTIAGAWRVAVGSFGPNKSGRNVYDSDNIYVLLDTY
jgi:general secretion pathway protein G